MIANDTKSELTKYDMTTAECAAVDKLNDNDFQLLGFKPIFDIHGERAGCELWLHSSHDTLADVVNFVCERAKNEVWLASRLFIVSSSRVNNNEWVMRIVHECNPPKIDWDNQ